METLQSQLNSRTEVPLRKRVHYPQTSMMVLVRPRKVADDSPSERCRNVRSMARNGGFAKPCFTDGTKLRCRSMLDSIIRLKFLVGPRRLRRGSWASIGGSSTGKGPRHGVRFFPQFLEVSQAPRIRLRYVLSSGRPGVIASVLQRFVTCAGLPGLLARALAGILTRMSESARLGHGPRPTATGTVMTTATGE